jgi:hypothetical protein
VHREEWVEHADLRAQHPVVRSGHHCPCVGKRSALENAPLRLRWTRLRRGRASLLARRDAVRRPRVRRRLRRDARRTRSDAMQAYDRYVTNADGTAAGSSGIAPRGESDGTHACRSSGRSSRCTTCSSGRSTHGSRCSTRSSGCSTHGSRCSPRSSGCSTHGSRCSPRSSGFLRAFVGMRRPSVEPPHPQRATPRRRAPHGPQLGGHDLGIDASPGLRFGGGVESRRARSSWERLSRRDRRSRRKPRAFTSSIARPLSARRQAS